MAEPSFVYEHTEVILTGRKAQREVGRSTRRSEPRIDELVEIKPLDPEDGSWTKFVRITDLYEITE